MYAYGAEETKVTGIWVGSQSANLCGKRRVPTLCLPPFSHKLRERGWGTPRIYLATSRINLWPWILILLIRLPPILVTRATEAGCAEFLHGRGRRNHRSHRMDMHACSPHPSDSRPHVPTSVGVVASEIIDPSQCSRARGGVRRGSIPRGYNPGYP